MKPVLLLALLLCGCAAVSKPRNQIVDTNPAPYESAKLSYRVEQPASTPAPPSSGEGQLVSFERAAGAAARQSVRALAIQYPHPDGKTGYALVEMVFESDGAGDASSGERTWLTKLGDIAGSSLPGVHWSEGIEEAWALDIPRAELDQTLVRLRDIGYFNQSAGAGNAQLVTQINSVPFNKRWDQVPELDALMLRVRREGRLISYARPAGPTAPVSVAPPGLPSFLANRGTAQPPNPGNTASTASLRRLPPVQIYK